MIFGLLVILDVRSGLHLKIVSPTCPYLLCLTTDAFRTGLNSRGINALLRAVGVDHAELEGRLPGPPGALLSLTAELVATFGILSLFEVEGIFLK